MSAANTTAPRRPSISREMIEEAANALALANGWDAEEAQQLAGVFSPCMDGYELAKALESGHYWDITVHDVEVLDQMDGDVDAIHRKACEAWAREYNIQPPLPIGTMTTRGEITGIREPAMYLIREPGCESDSRRLLLKFEHAHAVEAKAEGGSA